MIFSESRRKIFFVATASIAFVFLVRRLQSKLLYLPRRYDQDYKAREKSLGSALARHKFELTTVRYAQDSGKATESAFLVAPKNPTRLWMVYGGNAMLALDFGDFLLDVIQRRDLSKNAFLLMDFPGYGDSEASITPENTLENSLGALKAVEQKLGPLEVNGFGHSLGCAAILQFAAARPAANIILSAPFLSVAHIASSLFPFLQILPRSAILPLIRHNWDNEQELQRVLVKEKGLRLHIVHGVMDNIVPYAHGVELAKMAPDKITLHTSTHSSHNDILARESALYAQLLDGDRSKI